LSLKNDIILLYKQPKYIKYLQLEWQKKTKKKQRKLVAMMPVPSKFLKVWNQSESVLECTSVPPGPDGLHHLITEIFDNSRDEAMGGFADHIEVALLPGNRVRITDNGRGIPVDIHKQTKVSALETIMTTLHAGGKFGGEGTGYKV
jgi:hypothetical protein